MNYHVIMGVIGRLLIGYSLIMVAPYSLALLNGESSRFTLTVAILMTSLTGIILYLKNRQHHNKLGTREGFAIVSLAWLLTSLLGAIPFWYEGGLPSFVDALFESVSGLTTSGGSVINDVEALPSSLLLWRSLTHWVGGMGIIVTFVILLPSSGLESVNLFQAEVPGPLNKRIMPRIQDTAIALWRIYFFLTAVLTVLLFFAGMNLFDAVNHAFSTIATGGFSTKNNSLMFYNDLTMDLIIVFFIILAGGNFRLYLMVWRTGSFKAFRNTEFLVYLAIIAFSTLTVTLSLWYSHDYDWDYALRHALFQVVSLITGTGFASMDFDQWPSLAKMIIFVLMFTGGCSGSTTGGLKITRIIILVKGVWADLKKGLHHQAVATVKLHGAAVPQRTINLVAVFFFVYIMIFVLGSILLAGTGLKPFDAMSAVTACLGNVGPGFGAVGPATTFAAISPFGKMVLTLCMLLGRLEFFTLLILIRPEFWKRKKGW